MEVMLDNMRHFQKVALDAEAVIEAMNEEQISALGENHEEQFKALLAKVKQAAGLRLMAHECARDAAGYMHPRLANIQHSGDEKNPITIRNEGARDIIAERIAGIAARAAEDKPTSKPH